MPMPQRVRNSRRVRKWSSSRGAWWFILAFLVVGSVWACFQEQLTLNGNSEFTFVQNSRRCLCFKKCQQTGVSSSAAFIGLCIHKGSVEAHGVRAASPEKCQDRCGGPNAPDYRTLMRAEARAPTGADNLWLHQPTLLPFTRLASGTSRVTFASIFHLRFSLVRDARWESLSVENGHR